MVSVVLVRSRASVLPAALLPTTAYRPISATPGNFVPTLPSLWERNTFVTLAAVTPICRQFRAQPWLPLTEVRRLALALAICFRTSGELPDWAAGCASPI